VNSAIFRAALLSLSVGLFAQKVPTAPTRTGSGLPGTTTTNNTNSTTQPSTTTNTNIAPRPVYLSGKVVLQDGTPPPDIVKIERICGGNPRPQGYTDSKGRFQFQVDSQIGYEPDASDQTTRQAGSVRSSLGTTARMDLVGCDLRAVLPGFISGSVSLANHSSFDNPDVGIIVLRRAGNVEGTTISMSSLHAPKDAQRAYEKGRELMKKQKPEDAERSFQKAVDVYPGYAAAWHQLGLLQTRDRPAQAEVSFTKAVESDPKFVSPYMSLTLMFERSRSWEKALTTSDNVIKLNPADFPQAYFFKAVAHYNLRDPAKAEASNRKAIELDVRHEFPQAEKLMGAILADKSDLAGAAEHLRKYLELAPNASDAAQVHAQLAAIEKQQFASKTP
jgi:Tetratricopeptide repeat